MQDASRTTTWAAAAVLFLAVEAALFAFVDKPLSLWLRDVDAHHPEIIDIFRGYTSYAKADWYLWPSGLAGLACLALIWPKSVTEVMRRRIARLGRTLGYFFVCVAMAGIVTDLLKPLFGRARPVQLEQFGIYGFDPWHWFDSRWHSFPSGEATTAFAVAVALMVLFPRWRAALWVYAVAMAGARVMVNAHYLSDIVAGAVVGILTVFAVTNAFARRGWVFGPNEARQRVPDLWLRRAPRG